MKSKLSDLPAMNHLLSLDQVDDWQESYPHYLIKRCLEESLDDIRTKILAGEDLVISEADILKRGEKRLEAIYESSLKRTVNATGTVIHTNLGRSLLADEAVDEVVKAAQSYSNLEYDLEEGHRGSRYQHIRQIIVELTGAEDALLVNNNAAAVLLMLTALTQGKEVLISRGELVEIGGAFRIPDVIRSCGAYLAEVGATNKTHIADYAEGITEDTGAILRVHTSNYRLIGFTEAVSDEDLVALAKKNDLPIFNDLGSGLLVDMQEFGLPYEPTVSEMIEAGYDLVSFSGDKLLGGAQAGIIAGKKTYIDRLKKHPLLRALRTDKMSIAALEASLRLYLDKDRALTEIPTLAMIRASQEELWSKAEQLKNEIDQLEVGFDVKVIAGKSQVGGGAFPGVYLDTALVSLQHADYSGTELERQLRLSPDHIIARLNDGLLSFDVRTLQEGENALITACLKDLFSKS
ncbi:L-seryl-tRNA(Sec) selenium transferase [Aerococcus sanguinicola]|uniref:L-seryl-tRNA(Sec) selenium transferase n=1 Tax=unclassified Aerococcus TaxID=2618060 RepID=UPI0008A61767|nr:MULTISPECIES: L-seryl-tRNA(Sec) selenium transferase [unclassified Aerococcus]MDK6232737.1 L-seryl-tRNA(Sec) selenium transferase [Aerococcus sp. UMB10185]MDK6854973.1 L-seryl-tRNA(Sec) selenium transferase [Aerococcus sp. UMB7533]MDK8501761.1 L-seryl-tRNA(Sec) selenium transferase [Aerococcus sp. UMB1112A]OFN02731.1 L-selenocysteinyl-tRNA(Sec) synthase [Aerococcus sp. HMSC062A02]OHO45600.1 L-selenocysteinyl-tRNA(Sec) synthase [Aerococcus sp. HMSC035B07]